MQTNYISDWEYLPQQNATKFPDERYQAHIKKLVLNKINGEFKVDATIDEVKDNNYKVFINDGFLNIMVATRKFTDNKSGDHFSIIQKCSLPLPDATYSKVNSVRLVDHTLKIRLKKVRSEADLKYGDYSDFDDYYDPDF